MARSPPGPEAREEGGPVRGGGGGTQAGGDVLPYAPTVEKIRATFTVLRAFGSVATGHSRSATRFTMLMSLDFSATGRVTAAQLQVRPLGGRERVSLGAAGSPALLSRADASRDPGQCLHGPSSPSLCQLLPTLLRGPESPLLELAGPFVPEDVSEMKCP